MRGDASPATVVVCCGLPAGIQVREFAAWSSAAAGAGIAVTWVCRAADAEAVGDGIGIDGTPCDVALSLGPAHLESRPALRQEIATARSCLGDVACAVTAGAPALPHRDLLIDQGIHVLAVGGFDHVTRSSRRPPPAGWPCRSVVWGLWEVRTVPRPPRSALGRVLPWAAAMRLGDGSLTVVYVDAETTGDRLARVQFERLAGGLARRRSDVRTARLSDLPALLRAASQPEAGSVLKRAA